MHELAEQAGIELPEVLGRLNARKDAYVESKPKRNPPVISTGDDLKRDKKKA